MTRYRRFIPPLVPIAGAAVASGFAALMVERIRSKEKWRHKAELDAMQIERGSGNH